MSNVRKIFVIILIAVALIGPFVLFDVMPTIGDPNSAPNTHVSDYYIENAISECNSPNMVTAVIVDYRAFDTLLETTVMFLAGVGVVLILSSSPEKKNRIIVHTKRRHLHANGKPVYDNINQRVMIAIILPIMLVYAIYVLFHGEVSLGGGFQAGALIGMAYLLDVMVTPRNRKLGQLPKLRSAAVAGVGPFIYALCGVLSLIGGGLFLEYAKIPLPIEVAELHSFGILMVEIGVTIGVMGTIITILNAIHERVIFDDDINTDISR